MARSCSNADPPPDKRMLHGTALHLNSTGVVLYNTVYTPGLRSRSRTVGSDRQRLGPCRIDSLQDRMQFVACNASLGRSAWGMVTSDICFYVLLRSLWAIRRLSLRKTAKASAVIGSPQRTALHTVLALDLQLPRRYAVINSNNPLG